MHAYRFPSQHDGESESRGPHDFNNLKLDEGDDDEMEEDEPELPATKGVAGAKRGWDAGGEPSQSMDRSSESMTDVSCNVVYSLILF